MKAILLAIMLGLAATVTRARTAVAPPNVVVHTSMSPMNGAVIGQLIRVFVDVLFRGRMPRPPRVAIGDVAGAQVFRFEAQGIPANASIMGENYVGQRFEFAIYPRRGGALAVPPAAITLLDADGDPDGTATGEPIHADIAVPPGVDASQPVVATDSLTLEEQWTPDPDGQFRAGDALVRTITRTANDVPSLAMRDLSFDAPAGVRVYIDPAVSNDTAGRGQVVGRRIDRTTYVFEAAGQFELPDVTQPWWQSGERTLRRAIGVGHAVSVSAAAIQDDAKPWIWGPRVWRSPTRWIVIGAAILSIALVIFAGARAVRWTRATWTERHQRWMRSEAKAFRDLAGACGGADTGRIYRALGIWRAHLPANAREQAILLSSELSDILFSGDTAVGPWTAARSQALLANVRRFRARTRLGGMASVPSALPPLNPEARPVADRVWGTTQVGGTREMGRVPFR